MVESEPAPRPCCVSETYILPDSPPGSGSLGEARHLRGAFKEPSVQSGQSSFECIIEMAWNNAYKRPSAPVS